MTERIHRIGMWSGPRNISTALMRSFENRDDTVVVDEPLYSHYLGFTGVEHPGADEVMRAHVGNWPDVVDGLLGPITDGARVFYQKHMAHHLVGDVDRKWVGELNNVFLIREPTEMLTSLIQVLPNPSLPETGLIQQLELFQSLHQEFGRPPLVLDSRDVLEDPEAMLSTLCSELGIPFSPKMLNWPAGPRASDGVWAKYWYASVEESTGFSPYQLKHEKVPDHLQVLLRDCNSIYEELHRYRITS
ncbi:MAG: hypothetical protein ACI97A_000685 [Planctomycetota bacterium]|jgi:hypothetical protein